MGLEFVNWEKIEFWGMTALFNPVFLAFLLAVYFAGKLIGKLTINLNVWKFLFLCYLAAFIVPGLRDSGPIIGGLFLLGFASNYFRKLPDIFSWAESLGDVFFAFRHRNAYEEIQRQEREIEELKRQLYAAQMAAMQSSGPSPQQQQWKAQSQQSRQSASSGSGGGRGDGRAAGTDGRASSKSGSSQQQRGSSRAAHGASSSQKPFDQQKRISGPPPNQQQKQSSQGRTSGTKPTSNAQNLSVRDQHLVTLGLSPGHSYTPDEIRTAWRRMAKKTHPDTGGSKAAFIAVVNAYNYLK